MNDIAMVGSKALIFCPRSYHLIATLSKILFTKIDNMHKFSNNFFGKELQNFHTVLNCWVEIWNVTKFVSFDLFLEAAKTGKDASIWSRGLC